ncbi:MAG: IclR family transcriptional regulator [Oscillospiraceae bacterium]|nr:IclR family transcriptional regulator [Oscillospiraceae bacterium]
METRSRRVHAIEKSITLLDCFWKMRRPLSLRELEQMTGWAKSSIHGLLASMIDSAVVEQSAVDGKYRLGYHLFELGSAVSQSWDVLPVGLPHLQHIVDTVGESAYLARLSAGELILVACEEPHNGFRVTSEAGTRLPLYCTSQGKAILANRPASELDSLLQRKPITAYTAYSITQESKLRNELRSVRMSGVAQEVQEYKLGLKSVAAPIFDCHGECSYAVGIICISSMPEKEFAILRTAVAQAARAISTELGWRVK